MIAAYSSTTSKLADYTYDAWGEQKSETETTSFTNNPIRYAGQYYDYESGMTYLRARYYDSSIRRFISEDPHWNVDNMIYGDGDYESDKLNIADSNAILQSNNLYIYCMNNPIVYIDVDGEISYPGQIHNIVVNYVASLYNMNKEQTITYAVGWGRADLISNNGQVWDVKRNKNREIENGKKQVKKYTENIWKNKPDKELTVGGYISSGEFIVTLNVDTYYVNYYYAGGGVIAYDYYTVTDWETVAEYASAAGMALLSALTTLLTYGMVQLQPVY